MLKVAPCTIVRSYGRMVVRSYGRTVVRSYGRTVVRYVWVTTTILYNYGAMLCEFRYYYVMLRRKLDGKAARG